MNNRFTRRNVFAAVGMAGAVIPLTAVTSCGGVGSTPDSKGQTTQEPVTLRFGSIGGEPRTSHFTDQAKRFHEKNPRITVEHEALGGTGGVAGYAKLITQFVSGTAPDGYETALLHGYFSTAPFVQANLPLDPLISRAKYDLAVFFKSAVEAFRVGNKQLGFPWLNGPGYVGMYVNLEAFDRASVRPPTDSWTWDDYKTTVRQLSRPADDRWGLGPWDLVAGTNADQAFLTVLRSNGGDLLSKDGLKSLATDAPVLQALQLIADLHVPGTAAAPYAAPPTADILFSDFSSGRFATALNNSTGRDVIKRGGGNPRYEIVLPPKGTAGRFGNSSPHCLCITKAARNPDAVFLWLQHVDTREAATKVFEWVNVARRDVWDDPQFKLLPGQSTFKAMADLSPSVIIPPNGEVSYYKEFVNQVLLPVLRGQKTPRAAATEALSSLDSILAKKP